MKKCLLGLIVIWCASLGYAQSTQHDPALEKKYADEFKLKVTQETERAKDSLNTLYYGMAAVAVGATFLGILALVASRKQERELELLKTQTKASSA